MHISSTTLWLPKKGNSSEEYEDAAAPMDPVELDADLYRCAVADGATETSFSGLWARLLVNGYVEETDRTLLKHTWNDSVATKKLAWYAEEKAQSGAYAALVGLTLNAPSGGKQSGTWLAEALGDSCVIIIRDGKLIETFPMQHSEEFNSSPLLLSSNLNDDGRADQVLATKSGEWQSGDLFYLLSDAIARWTLKREEEHGDAANWLAGLKNSDQMTQFVDLQRSLTDEESRALLRNDDVTLMRIKVEA